MTWQDRLQLVIDRWAGTPYVHGACLRRRGVDCVRFVDAVLRELHRYDLPAIDVNDRHSAWHDRRGAILAAHAIARRYPNEVARRVEAPEPGDVIVYRNNGAAGPGHVLIAGRDPFCLWHATDEAGVTQTGWGAVRDGVMRVWRPTLKEQWA